MKWKTLGSKTLFKHPRLTVMEDDVELPNGHRTKYIHFGATQDAAMIIATDKNGKFLIQKEYSYPPDEVLYQLPGGAVEDDEETVVGAARELAEEAGLAGDLDLIGWFYINNRRSNQKMFVYHATNLCAVTATKDPEEEFEDFWFEADEIDNLIRTNEIKNYTLLAGWALYRATHPQL
ncbi:MAG: NUDIX hydrolase [Candidatus Saccharimonadales bacterium]